MCLPCMMYMKTENTCKCIIYLFLSIFKRRKKRVFWSILISATYILVAFFYLFVLAKKKHFYSHFSTKFHYRKLRDLLKVCNLSLVNLFSRIALFGCMYWQKYKRKVNICKDGLWIFKVVKLLKTFFWSEKILGFKIGCLTF